MEPFYTIVFHRSADHWVALCLENGLVGQGETKEKATARLREAIASFAEALENQQDIYRAPIAVRELHEFLTFDQTQPTTTSRIVFGGARVYDVSQRVDSR